MQTFLNIFGLNDFFGIVPQYQYCLASDLKEGTKTIHNQVEKHPFVERLLKNTLETSSYQQYLVDLRAVYGALEEGIKTNLATKPELKKIYFPDLERFSSLTADLDTPSFKELPVCVSEAASKYVAHLAQLAHQDPMLYVGHAYARYLGDVSGGLILKKHVKEKWPDALHFYDFSILLRNTNQTTVLSFKEFYKTCLDSLYIEEKKRKEIIQEAYLAFEYAEKMFDAIQL